MTTFQSSIEIAAGTEEVFAAIQDPKRLAVWWGPEGFTNTFQAFDFRPCGRWALVMHGPDGRGYPGEFQFAEIVPGTKVVLEHLTEPLFHLTIELKKAAAGTIVHWAQTFANDDVARRLEPIVVPANRQNLERLAAEVSRQAGRG